MRRSWLLLVLALFGCARSADKSVVKEAKFGVFFGGQIQQLQEIPKELDPGRQQHGFRLVFGGPLQHQVPVVWEVSLPGTDKGGPRPALVGQASAKPGESVLDVPLAFRAADPLGIWHAKVSADSQVVIDRDFTVVAPLSKPAPPRAAVPQPPTPGP